jgi:alpha-beta hydrolase superfamily lysophospholipase
MQRKITPKFPKIVKWVFWVVAGQLILANISAAFYAYKFTHLYAADGTLQPLSKNIFSKTWRLFTGPKVCQLSQNRIPSFSYQAITLKRGGKNIDAWYSRTDSARGCVIFFHGYTANKSFLLNEAALFKQWGYTVLLIDFRGHGESDGGTTTFGVEEADDVEKAFGFAKERGNKNIILYGVSMGAVAVFKAASEKDIQPTAIIADMPFASLKDYLKSRARVVGFPSQPFAFLVTLWIGIERGYNGFSHQAGRYAKAINCPVLLEWGERDEYVSKKETETIYHYLTSKNKKLIIYSTAGHESFLQVEPVTWQKEVKNFITAFSN